MRVEQNQIMRAAASVTPTLEALTNKMWAAIDSISDERVKGDIIKKLEEHAIEQSKGVYAN